MDRYRVLAIVLVATPWLVIAGAVRLARHVMATPHAWHAAAGVRSALLPLLAGLLGATCLRRLRADAASATAGAANAASGTTQDPRRGP
jgi:hypothetical protein